jgi:sorbitol-specific phosphotransferase system component IIC
MLRISPICASEKPCRLARRSSAGERSVALATSSATSWISCSWSMNQGSIFVAWNSSSRLAPARRACIAVLIRPSVGTAALASSSALSPGSPVKENSEPFFSSERSAFCSASEKLRPIAIASPTDFMVVVSVASACGNFSKAKRGTLTTT